MTEEHHYDKLVRDNIPDHIEDDGNSYVIHHADDEELKERLRDKLVEEAKEFRESGSISELADIFEVIDAIFNTDMISDHEIESAKKAKANEKGKFERRIVLETVIEEQ